MDDWDQDKLEEVIAQKHGTEKNRPTDIICKFFLDAVEKKMYGWWGPLCSPGCHSADPDISLLPLSRLDRQSRSYLQVLAVSKRQGVQVPACSAARLCPEVPDEGTSLTQPTLLHCRLRVLWELAASTSVQIEPGGLMCLLRSAWPLTAGATGGRSSQCEAH